MRLGVLAGAAWVCFLVGVLAATAGFLGATVLSRARLGVEAAVTFLGAPLVLVLHGSGEGERAGGSAAGAGGSEVVRFAAPAPQEGAGKRFKKDSKGGKDFKGGKRGGGFKGGKGGFKGKGK